MTIPIRGLLTIEGIRFLFTSFVPNFQNFGVIAVTFIAMMGAGLAEAAGLMGALIRKLVAVAPRQLIAFLIILVGGLSSVASDAGYLILIPLAAAAFASLGRNPIAGLAAGFGGVAATFAVNIIIQPIDAMLGEMTNEAIVAAGGAPQTIVSNYFFSAVSLIFLCIVATVITERLIEPRLNAADAAAGISRYWRQCDSAGRGSGRAGQGSRGARLEVCAVRLPGRAGRRVACDAATRCAAARPGNRRHCRQHAVHGQPVVRDRLLLPRGRHLLRSRRGHRSRAATTS